MKKQFTFVLTFLLVLMMAVAVHHAQAQGRMGINMYYVQPIDQLADAGYKDGMGISLEILSPALRNLPVGLQLGGQFTYDFNGERKNVIELPDLPGELGDAAINNQSIGLHGIARLITSPENPIQLYMDGIVGSKMFFSDEHLIPQENFGNEEYECVVDNLSRSFTFSYGMGFGAMVKINHALSIDLRTTYLRGSSARFVDLESVRLTEKTNEIAYDFSRAPTQTLMLNLGVNFTIPECSPSRHNIAH